MNIIIPAHSRLSELRRLLTSISRFLPDEHTGEIHVVIDGGENSIQSEFRSGEIDGLKSIKVTKHETSIGLKDNILFCGDLVEEIGPSIILEDDLVVGPNFLENAQLLLGMARQRSDVSAVALYNFEYNEFASAPALVRCSGLAKVQTVSSWGQVWWPEKWRDFRKWLADSYSDTIQYNVPTIMKQWPDTSWKKVFNYYLADNGQYSLVPPLSFVFNSASPGVHHVGHRNIAYSTLELGSPVYEDVQTTGALPSFDAYLEPNLETLIPGRRIAGIDVADIECNLYALKDRHNLQRDYVLTFGAVEDPVAEFDGRFGSPIVAALTNIHGKGLALVSADQFVETRDGLRTENMSKHQLGWLNNGDLVRVIAKRTKKKIANFL